MSTTNLLSHLRLANQGSDYLKFSFLRLQKPLSCYLSLTKISFLPNSNLNILLITWATNTNFLALQVDDMQNKSLGRRLLSRKDRSKLFKQAIILRDHGSWHRNYLPRPGSVMYVLSRDSKCLCSRRSGAVSSVYVHCGTLLNTPIVMFPYDCDLCGWE